MVERESGNVGKRYRDETEIAVDMLKFLSDGPRPKSRVMAGAFLSWGQLQIYGAKLLDSGVIELTKQGQWSITDKGREFLKTIQHADSLLKVKA